MNDVKGRRAAWDTGNQDDLSGIVSRAENSLLNRPALLISLVILALVTLPIAVWLDLRQISSDSLSRQAADVNTMISEIRSYYSNNVIGRIQQNDGKAVPVHNYEEVTGGIPIPATLSIELGSVIGKRAQSVRYRFVSDFPFKGRAEHNLDEFELRALAQLRYSGSAETSVTEISGALFDREIRMAVPVVMSASCVACHNSHPLSPKRDWNVGDIRGIQSITVAQPIAANILSFKFLLIYFLLASIFGLTFATLQWRQSRRVAALNNELENANSFLAAISIKISKYLSPQIYKSIFSGEKDAVIATERKKLTIFFSDIKDFTATTERLQPEALTELLNEYFTEMAKIALEHGATVDKFIGDAILAFFGDPESRGAREDALACVKMAIAMQARMEELGHEWRRKGFERPLQARMGINTGYCNVGNFGSNDRMDYTIIGAEANLAARLESIAEPGGIVLSYETYSLVQDHVEASALPPITLKGISREIIPYRVEGYIGEMPITRPGVIQTSSDGMRLYIDVEHAGESERKAMEEALSKALDAVRNAGKGQ